MSAHDAKHLEVDVVIVGAGLVGAALALALGRSQYRVALIDAQTEQAFLVPKGERTSVCHFDPRVSALNASSKSFMESLAVWPLLAESQYAEYCEMLVWDALGTGHIHFEAATLQSQQLGVIIENAQLLSAMHQRLQQQVNLTRCFDEKLVDIKLSASSHDSDLRVLSFASGLTISAGLVVAADGAQSRIRASLGFATREWDYGHQAIVTTVKTQHPHRGLARQRFSEDGPLAFLPLQDDADSERYCSIVWSLKTAVAREYMALDELAFTAKLTQAIEQQLGQVESLSPRSCFPLRQRHAKSYVDKGVVLIGDAAHTIHPLAGQGLNLGFKDVVALTDVLMQAEADRLPVNTELLLRRYQRSRQTDNLMMMGVMEGFKRLFEQSDPFIRLARNVGMRWLNRQNVLKQQLIKRAMGL